MITATGLILTMALILMANAAPVSHLGSRVELSAHSQPHIVLVLADDFGWGNIGYHAPSSPFVHTPRLNELKEVGIELDRHYACERYSARLT